MTDGRLLIEHTKQNHEHGTDDADDRAVNLLGDDQRVSGHEDDDRYRRCANQ